MILTVLGFAAALAIAQAPLHAGASHPAFAADGRLVLEIRGDLWLVPDPADPSRRVRLTDGPALDIQPAWTADGRAVIFASDRSGTFDLWRVEVGEAGAAGDPVRLTRSPAPDREPAVLPDGGIVFVRGRRSEAALWIRDADGTERRLIKAPGEERMPAVSPDGRRVAYIARRDRRIELRVLELEGGRDVAIVSDRAAGHPAWSPDGARIAFTTGTGTIGVWIVSADGGPPNLASRRHARPVWTPDGAELLLAELARPDPGYNGDPDRHPFRDGAGPAPAGARLWRIAAPRPVDGGLTELAYAAPADAEANGDVFDRLTARLTALYYSDPAASGRRAAWERLVARYRPRAVEARSDAELEGVIHAMLRERPPYREEAAGRAVVSSAHPLATQAGLEIFRKGGNVVDAAIAVSFAIGVVEPDASGIGGYGQMLIHLEGMDEPALIEFMSRAPEGASLDDVALRSATGAALANVPGTVDGMWRAWKRFGSGRVTWAELLEPAIRLAEEGFALDESFTTTLARERERFLRSEGARALFFPNGRALLPGDTLRNPDLARTLRQIAEGGADAFYRGEIARRIVADLRAHGSPITLHDLARYYAAWREPVRGTYRGHTIYSSAPPVSGGSTLVAQLNLLEHQAASSSPADDAATAHAMIEAWKLIPSTQGRIADPGLWPVDIEPFTSKDTAAQRWLCFDPTRASDPRALEPGGPGCAPAAAADPVSVRGGATGSGAGVATGSGTNVMPSPAWAAEAALPDDPGECDASPPDFALAGCRATGTTSFAVADADGNMVSVTQTLGTWGGNFHVTPGLGFLYNDKLNSYRLEPDGYGARLPNARHGSTIAPTLVFRGTGPDRRPLLAAGAAGNAWITSTVYQVVTAVIDRGLGPQAALEEPRFLLTRQPGPGGERELVVQIEDGYAPDVRRALEAMGHRLQPITFRGELRMGYGAAVVVDRGEARAGGDPRRSGAAGAYSP